MKNYEKDLADVMKAAAKVADKLYKRKLFADLNLSVDPNWRIEDYEKF